MAKRRIKQINCPNCDYLFNGIDNYCPNCGQENHSHKLPIKHFVIEAFEGYFHFDTKLINTIKDLILRPGLITKNYNLGKRARYISPVRLYIFVSFIFFLILSFQKPVGESSSADSIKMDMNYNIVPIDKAVKPNDSSRLAGIRDLSNATIDNYLDSLGVGVSWYNKVYYRNYIKFKTGHLKEDELRQNNRKNLSIIMFLLMPIFAFYVYLLHYKRKLYYAEHLIFSLHTHTMAFCFLSIWLLCRPFLGVLWVYFLFAPIIFIHGVWAMKVVYQQKIGILLYKVFFLSLIYLVTFGIFFIVILIMSLV